MRYDFDKEISRQGTCASKWIRVNWGREGGRSEFTDACFEEDRLLPLWVADMDLPCPQPVVDALVARAKHPIYGYTAQTDAFSEAVVGWLHRRHGWDIQPEWLLTTPGVVPALYMLVKAVLRPGEKIIVQPPVYGPFYRAGKNNDVEVVRNVLQSDSGRYEMDYYDLAEKVSDPAVKMLVLCSPHNPVGRVWSRDELVRLGELCLENDVLVVSDEIHCDLVYSGYKFVPFASISDEFAQHSVACVAPSKTFNLAGLQTSNIIIANEKLRAEFAKTLGSVGLHGANTFGQVALQAAFNEGEEWLDQVLEYVEGNLRFLQAYVAEHIPQITAVPPEGTYLVWLDCRRLGVDKWELKELMLEKARVHLNDGFSFGPEGEGFLRMNLACPQSIVAEALERMRDAIAGLGLPDGR